MKFDPNRALQAALQHHQAGQLDQAEVIYRQILKQFPKHADAWHFLGLIAHQRGQHVDAAKHISRAIQLQARNPAYHNNLGEALRAQGKTAEACAAYRQAIKLNPLDADALGNLGLTLALQKQDVEAVELLERALAAGARWPELPYRQGLSLLRLGRLDAAQTSLELARQWAPGDERILVALADQVAATGNWAAAVEQYLAILARQPLSVPALNGLGQAQQQLGRLAEARAAFSAALQVQPDDVVVLNNLGNLECRAGQWPEAAAALQRAVALAPHHAAIHHNLALLFQAQQQWPAAIAELERTLQLEPNHAQAWLVWGEIAAATGRAAEATTAWQRAVGLGVAPAAVNLGLQKLREGDAQSALAYCDQALAMAPELTMAAVARAQALLHAGDVVGAIESLQPWTLRFPRDPQIWLQLGLLQQQMREFDSALVSLQQAAAIDPVLAAPALAGVLAVLGDVDAALSISNHALQNQPNPALQLQNALLLPTIPASVDELSAWREHLRLTVQVLLADPPRINDPSSLPGPPFFLAYHGLDDKTLQVDWARLLRLACPSLTWTAPHIGKQRRGGRLRLGFLSRFFCQHTIGEYLRAVIAGLDRQHFEIHVYSFPRPEDDVVRYLKHHAEHWHILSDALIPARETIAAAELDVLIHADVGMDALTYQLAFARLAPWQCAFYGHPVTTGIDTIDRFITSADCEPDGAENHYHEPLLQLPPGVVYTCCERPPAPPRTFQRSDFGLGEGAVYLCPHSLFKIHPEMDPLLTQLLQQDPTGTLVVFEPPHRAWGERLRRRWAALPLQQIRFLPRQNYSAFRDLLTLADVTLDSLHFSGGGTSFDAFAAGCPVVTLPGAHMRGRQTAAMLGWMGLEEQIALNPQDYLARALALGRDAEHRNILRRQVADRSPQLFNDTRMIRALEEMLQNLVAV